jgi:hypothetical protein
MSSLVKTEVKLILKLQGSEYVSITPPVQYLKYI